MHTFFIRTLDSDLSEEKAVRTFCSIVVYFTESECYSYSTTDEKGLLWYIYFLFYFSSSIRIEPTQEKSESIF